MNYTYGTADGSQPVYGGQVYVQTSAGDTYQGTYYGGTVHVPGVGVFSTK